jgi:adenylate cyclase
MASEDFTRKLTAILSADVEGYSRLMGEDESATVRTLKAYRKLIANLVQKHRGRVVDSPGDNLLAEFASIVDSVQCAVEIQKELTIRNVDMPEKQNMEFRIGVHLGDVIEDENRIYGDGVNIAARLESLADAGGLCISESVYKQVKNKLALGYEFLGERSVKNIADSINVYRVLMAPEEAGKVIGEKKAGNIGWRWAVVAAVVAAMVIGAVTAWNFYLRPGPLEEEAPSSAKTTVPLAERASIAVLPFQNLSGDPEQEYFSDGITNDIITDLSKFRELLVIASNTAFTYKGKQIKIKEVSQELGVRYVLEGSVQKAGDKVRLGCAMYWKAAFRKLEIRCA